VTSEHISMNSNFGLIQVIGCLSLLEFNGPGPHLTHRLQVAKRATGEVTAANLESTEADLVAGAAGPRASELGASERAVADADPVAARTRTR